MIENKSRILDVTLKLTSLLYVCFYLFVIKSLPFFGDHVTLGSLPANYFYSNHFSHLIVPAQVDTGHPPLFPLLLAFFWQIFGRSLLVSHAFIMLFVIILFIQLDGLCRNFLSKHQSIYAKMLIIFSPLVLAQTAAMSVDIPLAALFFLGLNAILKKKSFWLYTAIVVLFLLSTRGIIMVGTLWLFHQCTEPNSIRLGIKKSWIYIHACIPLLAWHCYHYEHTGWLLANPGPAWHDQRETVDAALLVSKFFEYCLRYIEFGMLIPWLCIIIYAVKNLRTREYKHPLFLLLMLAICFFAVFMLPFHNPILVRYLLCIQLAALIYFTKIIFTYKNVITRHIVFFTTLVSFVAAHFFIYPIIDGWQVAYSWGDGSLAHLPLFSFREKIKNYIETEHINVQDVYTAFPEYKSFADTDLSDSDFHYQTLNTDSISACPYIIYSNEMNNIPIPLAKELKSKWIILQEYHALNTEMYLFKNPIMKP